MKRAAIAALLAVAACGPSAPAPAPRRSRGPSAVELKLAQHREARDALAAAQEKYLGLSAAYEKAREEYLKVLLLEVAGAKAKAGTYQSLAAMAKERIRAGEELQETLRSLGAALLTRAKAEAAMGGVDGELWEVELEAYGGRGAAAARADLEVKDYRDAQINLHVAQKAQQAAIAALGAKEFEFNATVADDTRARDLADRTLLGLRNEVDEKMRRLLSEAKLFDEASAKIHHKLIGGIRDPDLAARARQRLAARERVAEEVARAREALREALIRRAEYRAHEISYDAEITAALAAGFRDAATRDDLLARVRPQRDAASEARVAMQNEESAIAEIRRRLVRIEADISSLGY